MYAAIWDAASRQHPSISGAENAVFSNALQLGDGCTQVPDSTGKFKNFNREISAIPKNGCYPGK
jgi:hypothetical protein